MPPGEHAAGAVPALALLKVQDPSAENVAVRLIGPLSAVMITPVKEWPVAPSKEPTATDAVPSPVKLSVPLPGGSLKTTETSVVNEFVFGSQTLILLVEIDVIVQEEAPLVMSVDIPRKSLPPAKKRPCPRCKGIKMSCEEYQNFELTQA